MFGPFVTAFRTLTILPVPGKETNEFPLSIIGFPLVGLFLGGLVWVFYLAMQSWAVRLTPVFALLALATESLFTGALHLDGLGDCADAFPGKKDRQRILEILKDSRMGTFGVCAIAFDILFKFVVWSFCFRHSQIGPVIISLVLSRIMQGCLLVSMPNARKEGIAFAFSGNHLIRHKVLAGITLAVAGIFAVLFSPTWATGVPLLLSAALVTFLWALYCRKKIGGITGDCLGSLNELVEVTVLLVGVMVSVS